MITYGCVFFINKIKQCYIDIRWGHPRHAGMQVTGRLFLSRANIF